MQLLAGLNEQQQKAVTAPFGPTLVLAGPGSGKTRVLTSRVAFLVQEGVQPRQIMAVTFTNKAAREMRARIQQLFDDELRGLAVGTFHSICARILRREAERLPFGRDFVIYDSADQLALIKQAMSVHRIDEKRVSPRRLLSRISNAKNELIHPAEFNADTYINEIAARVYASYQELLTKNNALDFDDLLMSVVDLFRHQAEVLARYQQYYQHILVDEFQDTNMAQYTLLRQLAHIHHNLYVVGDPDQCFPGETPIQTPSGPQPIATLCEGDLVLAASGRGTTMPALVSHIEKRTHTGVLYTIVTRSGFTFRATPNHIVFVRIGVTPGLHYVYLMYRMDKGYRVGIASHGRSEGKNSELQPGLRIRINQENAERRWILRICDSREEAYYWESHYAFEYGIPTSVFRVRGRRMRMSQEYIDRLYADIDTEAHARRLMADLRVDWRYPHHLPQGTFRNEVNLRYFGDGRRSLRSPWNAHRIDLWSGDSNLRQHLQSLGYRPRSLRGTNWRLGLNRLQYDEAQQVAQDLCSAVGEKDVVVGAFLVEPLDSVNAPRFSLMPAAHLHRSMRVAVEKDGCIQEDEVVDVQVDEYHGDVYDLEIENLHNYVAGGIVVHNSVYRWRGADYRNVGRFQDDYPEALTILLEQNYRSTQPILDAAMQVIDRNPARTRKQLFTERSGGERPHVQESYNETEEAQFVVDSIASAAYEGTYEPRDCAVMYRTNAQSRVLEDAFVRAGVPYRLVGATRFYARREIKDVIAYLRLVHNSNDTVSLFRVINVPPRGIGPKSIELLQNTAQLGDTTPAAIMQDLAENRAASEYCDMLGARAARPLEAFGQLINHLQASRSENTIAQLIDLILNSIEYRDHIHDGTEESEERWNNVMELRNVAGEFSETDLTVFLEEVALVSDVDTLTDDGETPNAPTLMTLHAAKGLEFPVVFIVGLDDGVLPHQRSFDDPESMAEERRLFYVGLTRAKDRLILSHNFRRTLYGDSGPVKTSRFLDEIPRDLLTGHVTRRSVPQTQREAYKRVTIWQTPTRRVVPTPAPEELNYRSGQRISHDQFGDGIVIESKLVGGDELVIIAFESVGVKRLLADMANLKLLEG